MKAIEEMAQKGELSVGDNGWASPMALKQAVTPEPALSSTRRWTIQVLSPDRSTAFRNREIRKGKGNSIPITPWNRLFQRHWGRGPQ